MLFCKLIKIKQTLYTIQDSKLKCLNSVKGKNMVLQLKFVKNWATINKKQAK